MAEPPSGTVTLLFTDIEGSTRLLQRAGDAYADLLADHRRLLRRRSSARRLESIAKATLLRRLRVGARRGRCRSGGAAGARTAPVARRQELRVRMGLHTGEPRLMDGRYVGLDVHQRRA